jgi:hypothetical protein
LATTDYQGVGDLSTLHLLFSPTTSANQVSACSIYYNPLRNQLFIYDDAGTALSAPIVPGTPGSLSNSQCSVNTAGSSVSKSKYSLTLSVPVTFVSTFVAGPKTIFTSAGSVLEGVSTGWRQKGTWGTPQPPTLSLTPNTGSGLSEPLALTVTDPAGAGDPSTIHLLFNTTSANQVSACSIFYNPITNELFLYDDSGPTLSVPIVPGLKGGLSNSQCSVSGTNSSVTKSGTTLTLGVTVSFSTTFTGLKNVYASVAGLDGLKTGYVQLGTWTP